LALCHDEQGCSLDVWCRAGDSALTWMAKVRESVPENQRARMEEVLEQWAKLLSAKS